MRTSEELRAKITEIKEEFSNRFMPLVGTPAVRLMDEHGAWNDDAHMFEDMKLAIQVLEWALGDRTEIIL